jgi:hypothetical protein
MSPLAISVLAFALMLLGILAGGWVQGRLPEDHLSSDSKEVVKLSMGVMGTLTALVLGLQRRAYHHKSPTELSGGYTGNLACCWDLPTAI